MTPLERAKEVERNVSTGTTIHIKLALLQDLIAEIEQLQADRPVRSALKAANSRAEGGGGQ
jgi:hypothetical protein